MKMMYEMFKERVAKEGITFLPKQYQEDYQFKVVSSTRINEKKDALFLVNKDIKSGMSPTLYLDEIYQDWNQEKISFEQMLKQLVDQYVKYLQVKSSDIDPSMINREYIKSHVCCILIHPQKNADFLINIPHKEFLGLAVCYRCDMGKNYAFNVNNHMMKGFNIDLEELDTWAKRNTKVLKPSILSDMDEMMFAMAKKAGIPEELTNVLMMAVGATKTKVVTNAEAYYGASALLFEDTLFSFAEILGKNYYIIPSSVHELILMPGEDNQIPEQKLVDMVREVNNDMLSSREFLTDDIFYYDRLERKLVRIPAQLHSHHLKED